MTSINEREHTESYRTILDQIDFFSNPFPDSISADFSHVYLNDLLYHVFISLTIRNFATKIS
jgi:hypothetical protein